MADSLVRALVAEGMDIATAASELMRGRPDEDQLAFAASIRRSIFTFNTRDFARLHASWLHDGRHHAGIIVVTDQSTPVGEQIRRLGLLNAMRSVEDMTDRIEYLGAWR